MDERREESNGYMEQRGNVGDTTPPTFAQRLRELNNNLTKLITQRSDKFWGCFIAAGINTGVAGLLVFHSRTAMIVGSGLMLWGTVGLMGNHGKFRQN